MKNLLATLLCLLSLGSAGSALADVREYGPHSARFTIDVPSGWTASPTPTGVDLADHGKTTFLSIAIGKVKGRTPEQIANTLAIANTFAKKRGYSKVVKKGPGLFVLHGETDTGLRKSLVLFVEEERYATFSMSGQDMEKVAKIADTLKEKGEARHPAVTQEAARPLSGMPAADKEAPAAASAGPASAGPASAGPASAGPASAGSPAATDATGEPVNP